MQSSRPIGMCCMGDAIRHSYFILNWIRLWLTSMSTPPSTKFAFAINAWCTISCSAHCTRHWLMSVRITICRVETYRKMDWPLRGNRFLLMSNLQPRAVWGSGWIKRPGSCWGRGVVLIILVRPGSHQERRWAQVSIQLRIEEGSLLQGMVLLPVITAMLMPRRQHWLTRQPCISN